MGRNVCWNKGNTVLVSKTQYPAGQSGKKEIVYHLDYINKLLQCCYSNARQPHYQITEKAFYTAS